MISIPDAVHREGVDGASSSVAKANESAPAQPTTKTDGPMKRFGKPLLWLIVALALAGGGYYAWLLEGPRLRRPAERALSRSGLDRGTRPRASDYGGELERPT